MKALTLTQPWAWLVVHGGKDIENRTWNTKHRGAFLIHAAKGMKASDFDAAYDMAHGIDQNLAWRLLDIKHTSGFERGGIIGATNLYTVIHPLLAFQMPSRLPWHMPEQFGFVLGDTQLLPFLPCKGSLGFWGHFQIRDGKAVQIERQETEDECSARAVRDEMRRAQP